MKHEIISETEIESIASRISNADYGSLQLFLETLGNNILTDSTKDTQSGRVILGKQLQKLGYHIKNAGEECKEIAELCRPHNQKQD
ncbi:MAG: hypothetical protein MRY57_04165 [Candidatus Pacebacteria bacterium]|nr:hypothetical protein [Candidatus Paceibacterota bacterium]